MTSDALTPRQLNILTFEAQNTWWSAPGEYENAVRERFGVSFTAYGLELYRLLRVPEALAHDPVTVRRLLARVDERRGHSE